MPKPTQATSALCTYNSDAIYVRDKNLVDELVGEITFTEMMYFQTMGTMPNSGQTKIFDAVLVTLMEHGITPSVLAARMTAMGAPEAIQGAIASGILGVGGQFMGTMEGCARCLQEIISDPGGVESAARRLAEEHRTEKKILPGFGHNLHKPDDPRSPKLLSVAEAQQIDGKYIHALRAFGKAIDQVYGRHLTINATGAIAAVLLEIGIPWTIMRGFAVVTRAAGIVGHIKEEQENPAGNQMWMTAAKAVEYSGQALKD